MTDRGFISVIVLMLIVGFILFIMMPQQQSNPTATKVRDTVRTQIHETADRLGNAFDAAKDDVQRIRQNHQNNVQPDRPQPDNTRK